VINIAKVSAFFIFLLMLAFFKEGWALSAPQVTVYTGKPSYNVEEDIYVYGDAKVAGTPVENVTVALEVRDPAASPITVRALNTNASGSYGLNFRLPADALAGRYTVNVTCSYGGDVATNATSFYFSRASLFVLAVTAGRFTYKVEEPIEIYGNAALGGVHVVGSLVAVEVQDSKSTPIVIRVLETDADGIYRLTFQLPQGSPTGVYSVQANANYENQTAVAGTTFQVVREIRGDINGDGVVNIIDIALVAMAWGSRPGLPRWDPRCDLDGNEVINILDITLVARDYRP
jgi:hypothetical protein